MTGPRISIIRIGQKGKSMTDFKNDLIVVPREDVRKAIKWFKNKVDRNPDGYWPDYFDKAFKDVIKNE